MSGIEDLVAVRREAGHETSSGLLVEIGTDEQHVPGDCLCTINPDPLRLPWDDMQ